MNLRNALSCYRVVDLGVGMAGALVSKFLAEAGASVSRIEPPGGDPFYEIYPAYRQWHTGKTILPDASAPLADADICIVGGEDFPGLQWRHDASELSARFPRLVVIDLTGYAVPLAGDPDPAVDLLVQATTGLVYERYEDRPIYHPLLDPTYGAALQGLIGALSALWEREQSGLGQIVTASLQQGALCWRGMQWLHASGIPAHQRAATPKAARQLICRCADNVYIQFTRGGRGAALRINTILGIDDPSVTIDTPPMDANAAPRDFFGDVDQLSAYTIKWQSGDLLKAFQDGGITAELVLAPGACWDDPQVRHNGILVTDAGNTQYVGFPIAAGSQSRCMPTRPQAIPGGAPLSGIRILDLGSFIAGPSASRFLGDLGAEVIKLEPMSGDPVRLALPNFAFGNRGKQSIAVDMKSPEGIEIVRRLCLGADIVQHNFRADVAKRLGVDSVSIQGLKPEIIVLETTGYGVSGPKAAYPGFDMVLQAFCGHEMRLGGDGNAPEWSRMAGVDTGGGMLGAIAMLLALLQRAKSGVAACLDVNLLNSGLYLMSELVRGADGRFRGAPNNNPSQTGLHPAEQLYQARDGWIAVAARSDGMARDLLGVLELGNTIAAPRAEWTQVESQKIAAAIARWTVADILKRLTEACVWAAPCRRDPESYFFWDDALIRLGAILHTQQEGLGDLRQIGAGFQLSRSPLAAPLKGHIPALGESTRAILASLGYQSEEIDGLYKNKIVA